MHAQGIDSEATWDKPLRYAQAIIMADLVSLDKDKPSGVLEKLSWEVLSKSVFPYGLFARKIDWDTKIPRSFPFRGDQRSHWEIPIMFLKRRFPALQLDR